LRFYAIDYRIFNSIYELLSIFIQQLVDKSHSRISFKLRLAEQLFRLIFSLEEKVRELEIRLKRIRVNRLKMRLDAMNL